MPAEPLDDRHRSLHVNPRQHQRQRAVCRAPKQIGLPDRVADEPPELTHDPLVGRTDRAARCSFGDKDHERQELLSSLSVFQQVVDHEAERFMRQEP